MAGYIEDRWLKKRPDKQTGKRERTSLYGKGKRYRVKGIPGVQDRSFDTSEDAKSWLATAKTDAQRGEFIDPRAGDISLTDYIVNHWWPSRSDEPSTAAPMRSRIWNHIIPLLGDLSLREIDASALRSFAASLLSRVENTTAEVIWGHLSTILTCAADDKRILHNPIKVHKSVKAPRRTAKKAKAWTRAIVDAVRLHIQDRYKFAVDLGLGLGLRQGEAFGLAEEDFDFEAGVVHVRRQLRWDAKGRPYFCLPKGQKTRTVPLPPNLAVRAREHFRKFPSVSCTLPWRNPEPPTNAVEARQRKPITVQLVLTTSHGNRIYYRTWNDKSWKPALAAAGLIQAVGEKVERHGGRIRRTPIYAAPREDMFHVLRHTYASVQLAAGESVVSLSVWMGHSTPKITLEHYAHFMPGAGQRGLSVMNSWLESSQTPNVPEKSLLTGWIKKLPPNPQVKVLIAAGARMNVKYKETARGGLAVNIIEC
ncbi:tyrosine-type recombinase/integrase [Streptomyces acidiscabies]|uniref:Tyrosine-type recombinase/integrase n=1 Tax=Streptomyces acidiscabies TaxID=42234 RepID=A0AAP6BKD1_9ACTN|nr:tyrosine-type recombinase/integrase [Streptomyces acidiscabies]MBP5936766.1 tyrosine-type recombinase/integrase [Streptomyces sp. LBUM 1476]MBZ3915227.1 tyrosine-type recombinase/integrase [Streptomyces acidiscabies]MDX2966082.1 tyrosine-type recombinase/integrase [Streptomyces acidiscabies]MDX3021289.1 tyrosine-type recombinase/integrase [Streptomyces acidiscabies]MDX3793458.1 tyrosine-type recombinase/integrase [Streptomyces acidiscabies]